MAFLNVDIKIQILKSIALFEKIERFKIKITINTVWE